MFRILSLDGGGIRGAYAAACLARIEKELSRPITDYFDLIAGTSTGGIIALALALGERAERIRTLYSERGPRIFTPREPVVLPLWERACLTAAKWKFPSLDQRMLHRSKALLNNKLYKPEAMGYVWSSGPSSQSGCDAGRGREDMAADLGDSK